MALLTPGVFSQNLINPASPRGKAAIARIDRTVTSTGGEALSCSLRELEPVLNFTFRHQAGYQLTLPIKQFPTDEVFFRIFLRLTSLPDGRRFYFWKDHRLAAGARPGRLELRASGGFFVGEGNYRAELMLTDSLGRECRKAWNIRLRLKGGEEKFARLFKPGTVAPLILDAWRRTDADRPFRIAVFVHLAPLSPRRERLTAYDRALLVSTLTALLERTPFHELSVHALSLQHQQELFSSGPLDGRSLSELFRTMEALELGTIDLAQLSNPKGHVDLLAGLVNREVASPEPPDAIVFIGPNSRYIEKFPRERIETGAGMPRFFYLHLDYNARRYPWADTIERLTEGQGGKVFKIHSPRDFASAIGKMEAMLAASTNRTERQSAVSAPRTSSCPGGTCGPSPGDPPERASALCCTHN